jgi:malonyl-CoA decarboxylase
LTSWPTVAKLAPPASWRRWLQGAAPELAQEGVPDEAQREALLKACARYLVEEKKGGQPLDPVAQFHLHNGASVDRIFWKADLSQRGLAQSCGLMASYRYDLDAVDCNHEEFLNGAPVAAARRVLRLL